MFFSWVKERVGPLASSSFPKVCGVSIARIGVNKGESEGDVGVEKPRAIWKLMLAKVYAQRSTMNSMVALMGRVPRTKCVWIFVILCGSLLGVLFKIHGTS